MKNVTVSLDDETYRNAKVRAAEDGRSLSSVVREVIQTYGVEGSEFERLTRERAELLDSWRRDRIGIDLSHRLTREEANDRELSRLVLSDAYK